MVTRFDPARLLDRAMVTVPFGSVYRKFPGYALFVFSVTSAFPRRRRSSHEAAPPPPTIKNAGKLAARRGAGAAWGLLP